MNGTGSGTGIDEDWEEMFADLGRFEGGAIPVDTVLRRGEGIRSRRRVAGTAALSLAAVLSIGVPVLITGSADSGYGATAGGDRVYGASSTGPRVTVNPTPRADGKGHFSGTVDGKPWSVDYDNEHCLYITWSCGFPDTYPGDDYASLTADTGPGQPADYVLFLKKDVARVTITLQDGEVLRMEAVPVVNLPVVLFSLPSGLGITKVDLFDAHGEEIAYSLPLNVKGNGTDGAASAGHWYKPGDAVLTQTGSVELLRGELAGQTIVMTASIGPSGPCVVSRGNADCTFLGPVTGSERFAPASTGGLTGDGLVGPNVDHMRLEFADGTSSPVTIKNLGGYRFFAYIVDRGKAVTAVIAYDAAGKALPDQKNTG